jgi:hypothetical protein
MGEQSDQLAVFSGHPIAPRAAWVESHRCGVVRIDLSELAVDSSRLLMLRRCDPARIASLGDGGRRSPLKAVPRVVRFISAVCRHRSRSQPFEKVKRGLRFVNVVAWDVPIPVWQCRGGRSGAH